jgi:hypothetical protein
MVPFYQEPRPRATHLYTITTVCYCRTQETPGAPEDMRGIKRDTRGAGGHTEDPRDTGRTEGHSGGIGQEDRRTTGGSERAVRPGGSNKNKL